MSFFGPVGLKMIGLRPEPQEVTVLSRFNSLKFESYHYDGELSLYYGKIKIIPYIFFRKVDTDTCYRTKFLSFLF